MKAVKYKTLTTKYMDDMDRDTPFADYPRPSMRRESYISLNGSWDFAVGGDKYPELYEEKILVPYPPESLLSGIERDIPKGAVMYYRRSFSLPDGFVRGRILLHFGAVDTICEVKLNGTSVISHEGGYLPFYADITDDLIPGENTLTVRVIDNLDHDYPYGKQKRNRGGMWYTPVSGIWQTVWLESVPDKYIEKIRITPSLDSATIEVFGGEDEKTVTLSTGERFNFRGEKITVKPEVAINWSPENPHLYEFTLESGDDTISSYFALRTVECKECDGIPRLCLNGKPYLFNGLLDQGYYPDGIFLPATPEAYLDDILLAKSMGFNMLRKHIKVEPEIFYYLCDRQGICVFQDMVNNSGYSFILDTALPTVGPKSLPDSLRHLGKKSRKIFEEHSLQTLDCLYNHPSIVYYTVFNEGWGQFLADKMYRIIKSADPTRIVDATSGWFWRKESDVDSRHVYFKAVKLGRVGKRPIVISEFGGYSHRVEGHLFGSNNYGYKLFSSDGELEDAVVRLYSEEIAPLIPQGVSGLVYTQISDVEDETNGIVTYDRRHVKLNAERIRPIMERLAKSIQSKESDR